MAVNSSSKQLVNSSEQLQKQVQISVCQHFSGSPWKKSQALGGKPKLKVSLLWRVGERKKNCKLLSPLQFAHIFPLCLISMTNFCTIKEHNSLSFYKKKKELRSSVRTFEKCEPCNQFHHQIQCWKVWPKEQTLECEEQSHLHSPSALEIPLHANEVVWGKQAPSLLYQSFQDEKFLFPQ